MAYLRLVALCALVATGSACGASTPSGPSLVRLLRGFVSNTSGFPLAGATVEVLDGSEAGRRVVTDGEGAFALAGVLPDTTRLRVTREGYVTATGTIAFWRGDGPINFVTIALSVLALPVSIVGD